jgi:hypothetical protein
MNAEVISYLLVAVPTARVGRNHGLVVRPARASQRRWRRSPLRLRYVHVIVDVRVFQASRDKVIVTEKNLGLQVVPDRLPT